MKKSDIEKFKQRLEEMRARMLRQLESSSAEVQAPDEAKGYSQHQADEGTDDFDRTISISLSAKERDVLRQVERALEKIQENTFGICDVSGKKIPIARLDAIPYACMTVESQEQMEKGLL